MTSPRDLAEQHLKREVYAGCPAVVPVIGLSVPYGLAALMGLPEARRADERTARLISGMPDDAGVLSLLQLASAIRWLR